MKTAQEMAELASISKVRLQEEAETKRWEKITSTIDDHANRGYTWTSFNQLKEIHVNKLKELGYEVYDFAVNSDYYGNPSFFTYVFWDTDEAILRELTESGIEVLRKAADWAKGLQPKPSISIREDVKPKKKWWKF